MVCLSFWGVIVDFGIDGEHPDLDWLRPVLRRWGHFLDDYCAAHAEDVPYYYNEQASVSVLAAAAWGPGSGALAEYRCQRQQGDMVWSGQADLYVYDRTHAATIEAKQVWWTPQTTVNTLREGFDGAAGQARSNRDSPILAAAVFATLSLSENDELQRALEQVREQMLAVGADVVAWALPHDRAPFRAVNTQNEMRLWPGVVLGLRAVGD